MSFDRYVYPGTTILKNKFGIMDASTLEQVERGITSAKILKLDCDGVIGQFDVAHLKSIHRRIFGDIYDWAGEFRDIQIWKGGTEFSAPEKIQSDLNALCSRIKSADYFRGMPRDMAANAFADVMVDLNQIHPFREGNGRTQRAFVGQLAKYAGYRLDFTKISENDMRDASFSAAHGRRNLMQYLFRSSISENGIRAMKKPLIVDKRSERPLGRLGDLFDRICGKDDENELEF